MTYHGYAGADYLTYKPLSTDSWQRFAGSLLTRVCWFGGRNGGKSKTGIGGPMKVAILAGGLGSRLAEETETKPKPMVEVGGKPILWHIMKYYTGFGFQDFVVALGYKGEVIKRWMLDTATLTNDLTVDLRNGDVRRHDGPCDEWQVSLIDTGQPTETGGRIKRLADHIGDETFMLTWGDGLSDINLDELLAFHRAHGKLITLSAVRPPARFGHLEMDGNQIVEFSEKP